MQKTEIIGYLGQDAVVKDLGTNQVINFSVAVSESYVNKTTGEKITNTVWYECAKWGNNTSVAQYLKKGTQVYISGKPTARAWQNEQGNIIPVLGITVYELELLGGGKSESSSNQNNAPASAPVTQQNETPSAPLNNLTDEPDDMPF